MTMNIVDTVVDAESQPEENDESNEKENEEETKCADKENKNRILNEEVESSESNEDSDIQNGNGENSDLQKDEENSRDSQNDDDDENSVEMNGSCEEENEEKTDDSTDKKDRKITIVLNSEKGYEIKNNKNDTPDDTDVNEDTTTEDSVSEKSEVEEEEESKKTNRDENNENDNGENEDDADDGEKNGSENDEDEEKADKKNTEGENDDSESDGVQNSSERDEEMKSDDDDDNEKSSEETEKMVNGEENGTDEDEDDEKDTAVEIDEEVSPEFDNKYEGKTSQLPNFAVVCSFLNMFGAIMDLPNITLPELEETIDSTKEFSRTKEEAGILELLHVKLFRKLAKSSRLSGMANCTPDRLHKIVLKFCQAMHLDFTWNLEQFGYHILTSDQKLIILKTLCEVQFDENAKFRNDFTELYKADPTVLRLSPFGYEQDGSNVWVHEDTECNIHVYSVEDEDTDGNTWRVRVGCLDDMATYISKLKIQTEVNPKDIAAVKIKERRIAREEERQRKKAERDLRRKEEEEKRAKKKGRSTRRSRGKKKEEEPVPSPIPISETSEEEEDDGCIGCLENRDADVVLLCDGCDAAYHTLCLRPPVMVIPDDDWFCPFCLQVQLVQKLELKYIEIKNKLKKKERKAKRLDFYGIRSDNIVDQPEGRRVGRAAARRVDYNFTDYDQLISEAVQNYKNAPPVQPRREGDEKRNDGTNGGSVERSARARRNIDSEAPQRKYAMLSSDEYVESEGSEYVNSSADEVTYNNMRNFIVNDDIDEIEERYSRNKRLRRSGRNHRSHKNTRSSRRKRRKYEDDSDFGEESDKSDKSSDDDNPRRRLRERKAANMQNLYMYSGQFSDEDEIEVKEVDDGGEWAKENEDEEVIEEIESDEVSSNPGSESEKEERSPRPPPRQLRARAKRKRYVVSDDDSDEEVPCVDESEEENNNKIEIDDESEEEEEEESKEVEDGDDDDEMDDAETIDDDEDEEKTENEPNDEESTEEIGNEISKNCAPEDELMREIKEEEKNAGINLKDDTILKSSTLPPCFSSSLPSNGNSPQPPPPELDTLDPPDTNVFRSSETESATFNANEFWKELTNDNKKVAESDEIEAKPDIKDITLPSAAEEPKNENASSSNELPNTEGMKNELLTNIKSEDNTQVEKIPNDNSHNAAISRPEQGLNTTNESSSSNGNFTVTSTGPLDISSTNNLSESHSSHPKNTYLLDRSDKQNLSISEFSATHGPGPDAKPKISEMNSPHMAGAPTSFSARPPPPYHPQNYTPQVSSRMTTPPLTSRGPLHPQHRLRAMAAALQARTPSPSIGARHQPPMPVGPHRSPVPRHPQSMPPGSHHMRPTSLGPRPMPSPHGARHQQPRGPHQQMPTPSSRAPRPATLDPSLHRPVATRPPNSPADPRHHVPGIRPGMINHQLGRPTVPSHTSASLSLPGNHLPGRPTAPPQSSASLSLPSSHSSGRPPAPSHSSSANPSLPTHPSLRLPTHPSARLRAPAAVSSARQTPPQMRPTHNYPYPTSQPGMRAPPPDWRGNRPPYDYYQQFQRPPNHPSSAYYGGQSNWPRGQPPPDWDRLKQQGEPNPGGNGITESKPQDSTSQKSQTKEYKEHMKQLKEHAKQEKEMKKLQKMREKELKKQKRPYSPQPTPPSNTPAGNMAYFKNMVIGGDGGSGGEGNANPVNPYPPFKASRM